MTIKELYEWASKMGCENYAIVKQYVDSGYHILKWIELRDIKICVNENEPIKCVKIIGGI